MNLIAKEYCASKVETNGVLILSEFAGASQQMGKSSLLVNPFNFEEVADRIYSAYQMPKEERMRRMRRLRADIRRNNIFRWVEHFLSAVGMPLPKPHSTAATPLPTPKSRIKERSAKKSNPSGSLIETMRK